MHCIRLYGGIGRITMTYILLKWVGDMFTS